jgi:acetylornithine deacetylase/succinyl-diaminopimelate desuccinylase-like protein
MDVISLTQKLLAFNNTNPPGKEKGIAIFNGELLKNHGFNTEYIVFTEGGYIMLQL